MSNDADRTLVGVRCPNTLRDLSASLPTEISLKNLAFTPCHRVAGPLRSNGPWSTDDKYNSPPHLGGHVIENRCPLYEQQAGAGEREKLRKLQRVRKAPAGKTLTPEDVWKQHKKAELEPGKAQSLGVVAESGERRQPGIQLWEGWLRTPFLRDRVRGTELG